MLCSDYGTQGPQADPGLPAGWVGSAWFCTHRACTPARNPHPQGLLVSAAATLEGGEEGPVQTAKPLAPSSGPRGLGGEPEPPADGRSSVPAPVWEPDRCGQSCCSFSEESLSS